VLFTKFCSSLNIIIIFDKSLLNFYNLFRIILKKQITSYTGEIMKINDYKLNNTFRILFVSLLALSLITPVYLYSAQYDTWGIPKDAVMKKYNISGDNINEFTPAKNPDYENKIMNMVKLILKNVESEADKDITVISTKTTPQKDYLLYKNKLFSIMELYNSVSKEEMKSIVKKLSGEYGEPNHNPGSDMEIYFISTKSTKIIVHYYLKSKKCEVYYYDSQLYHKLSSNDF
jgi:hypothetical protein